MTRHCGLFSLVISDIFNKLYRDHSSHNHAVGGKEPPRCPGISSDLRNLSPGYARHGRETAPKGKDYMKGSYEDLDRDLLPREPGLKKSAPRFKKVVVFSGHMIDAPDRVQKGLGERFPPRKEPDVRMRISKQVENWGVGPGDLAICGGARGGDILFAELCADRGAELWLFIALPETEFLEQSVRLPDSDWEQRYFDLRNREGVKVSFQDEQLTLPAKGSDVFARNNLWMINTARAEADDPKNLYALLVWDEKPTGDGPGGTSDFVVQIKKLGGRLAIINPTKL
jgi:hypothetical protein